MNITQETLASLKKALADSNPDLLKAWEQSTSATSGLTAYDLEAPAKLLYPVLTPLRNRIPRVGGHGGIQANWRAITGINTGGLSAGVSHGNRGGVIASKTQDYLAAYKGLGLEDNVTFEAEYAGETFEDVRAVATEGLLRAVMIQEEFILLGGNSSLALGTTPTPVLAASGTGGNLATATLSVICVALTNDGYLAVAGGNLGNTGQQVDVSTAVVPGQISRTNADATTDNYGGGSAEKSANATVSVTGPTGSVGGTVTPVTGAVAYAWFWGTAGSEKLGAITTINSVNITADATGSQLASSLPASDNSQNSLLFDGLLAQILKSGSGAYSYSMPTGTAGTGTPLTTDNAGGIKEINDAFRAFWNLYRLSPDVLYVNSQELENINSKVIAAGGAPLYRFNVNGENPGTIDAGIVVGSYLNKFTNRRVRVEVHPAMPPGTMMFFSDQIPYKLSDVRNPVQVRTRREYYQIEWPLRTRKYEYGVYADEVLQCYFPPAFGVINNIANG